MSRVYFTTEHEGTAELYGSERAWMGMLCTDLAAAIVPDDPERLSPRLTPTSPLRPWLTAGKVQVLPRWIRTYLATGIDEKVFADLDGTPLETFDLVLNTALALGSNPVCLMVRLHAQCEIHCYVEGAERAWLAGVIDDGLAVGVMRQGEGWEAVTALLRGRDDQPVVCHYSVTSGFPNASVAEWQPPSRPDKDDYADEDWDAWYDLPAAEQWQLSMAGLYRQDGDRRLTPDGLRAPFGHTRSLIDLFVAGPRAATLGR